MKTTSKKIAAALAAVNTYLQEESAAQGGIISPLDRKVEPAPPSAWGMSGRQQMMSLGQLVQLKAFTRF